MIISRRQFLKYCSIAAGALGLSASTLMKLDKAMADIADTAPNVVWLAGQGCSGCVSSLLNSMFFTDVGTLLLDKIDLCFETTVASAAGVYLDGAEQTYSVTQNLKSGVLGDGFVLLVEGAIPEEDYCHVGNLTGLGSGNESVRAQLVELCTRTGSKAGAVVSIGTCASFGGIPAARGNLTGAQSAKAFLESQSITTPVVNVPGCPPHPDWMVGTILTYMTDPLNLINNLNSDGAPRDYYGEYQCNAGPCTWRYNNSTTRPDADTTWVEGNSQNLGANKWTGTDVGCIGILGCKGRKTKADCSARKWNGNTAGAYGNEMSWCVGSRGGCHGCANPSFPDGVGKFFTFA